MGTFFLLNRRREWKVKHGGARHVEAGNAIGEFKKDNWQ